MRAKSLALLVVALGCGLVASIGITQVIAKRDTAASTEDTQAIFVAVEDVPYGKPITPELVRLEQWPKDRVPGGALCRIEDVEGRRARTTLYAGEPIRENKLLAKGASQGYTPLIPKGFRVVRVKVNNVSSGLILPGDCVDVLVHLRRNPGYGISETATRTILQDVTVFAVDNVVETEGLEEKAIPAQTVSLVVTPEHAELVMLAEELGNIRLIMRNTEDDEIVKVGGTTPAELLEAAGAGDSRQEELLKAANPDSSPSEKAGLLALIEQLRAKKATNQGGPQQPANRRRHQMRIVSGPDVRDVVLETDINPSDASSGSEFWRVSGWGAGPGLALPGNPPGLNQPVPQEKKPPAAPEKQPEKKQETKQEKKQETKQENIQEKGD